MVICAQAIGATTPAATALFALALLRTAEQAVTYVTLLPIMAGIVLATGFEPSFHTIGFLTAVGACGARAFKAVLQVHTSMSHILHSDNINNLLLGWWVTVFMCAVRDYLSPKPGSELHRSKP